MNQQDIEDWLNEEIRKCDVEIAMRLGMFVHDWECRRRTYAGVLMYVRGEKL